MHFFTFASVKKKDTILENILVSDYAAEGKALARQEGKVVFIEGAVPGDRVDVRLFKNKKDWAEGRAIRFHALSPERVAPFCEHFGVCGGCKWQMLPYEKQLQYKQQQVEDNLARIGKLELPPVLPIIGSQRTTHYRNKLEFTFSNRAYLTEEEIRDNEGIRPVRDALGFHIPKFFDKVLDIRNCYLQEDPGNLIRNTVKEYAVSRKMPFYDLRAQEGWLRNLVVRICTTGEIMVNLVLHHENKAEREQLLDHLLEKVPSITTLLYTLNPKANDTIHDLTPQVYSGPGYILEKLGDFRFKIGPKSFFQTNTRQGEELYRVTREFAGLTGKEMLYDLYCGAGSIGIFLSPMARRVVGIELVPEAVEDALENVALNGIASAAFVAGNVTDTCNDAFIAQHGKPDVIITDPPRAGMQEKLIRKILELQAPRIVYVSCNPATQARDLLLLGERYRVEKIQPVDMFPHTHHIENVVLLEWKD